MQGRNTGKNLQDLPPEMLEHIFQYVDGHAMLRAHQTSRSLLWQFSLWQREPIPNRQLYLSEHANRAKKILQMNKALTINALLLGNRSIQANIISRPKYFLGDTIFPLEETEEDTIVYHDIKLKIFSSLHAEASAIDYAAEMKRVHLLLLCVSSAEDYQLKIQLTYQNLDKIQARPIIFILKSAEKQFEPDFLPSEQVINILPSQKRDWLAGVLVERLFRLNGMRQRAAAELEEKSFKKE